MPRLDQLAKVIRSKNAGPFCVTLDVLFADDETYHRVERARVITAEKMAALYRMPPDHVKVYNYAAARAIKVSLARAAPAGSVADTDLYGAQHHVLLYPIEVA